MLYLVSSMFILLVAFVEAMSSFAYIYLDFLQGSTSL
jgi:hypothetical protein